MMFFKPSVNLISILSYILAMMIGVLGGLPFQASQKKESVNYCLRLRFAKTLNTNKKAHGYTVSVSLSCSVKILKFGDFSLYKEKQKRFCIYMLINRLNSLFLFFLYLVSPTQFGRAMGY